MPLSRQKSCFACQKARARCSRTSPCHRCTLRHLECAYQCDLSTRPASANLGSSFKSRPVLPACDDSSNVHAHHAQCVTATTSNHCTLLDNISTDTSTVGNAGSVPDVAAIGPTLDVVNEIPSQIPFLQWSWLKDPIPSGANFALQPSHKISSSDALLASHMKSNPQSNLTYKVLIGQLLSYPQMMLTAQLPPFIHPDCSKNAADSCGRHGHHCLPPALANCRTIVAMFETMTVSNYDFIWRIIRSEAERLISEVSSASSSQAVTWLTLRVSELVRSNGCSSDSTGSSGEPDISVAGSQIL
jgi:hypothetical protein